MSQQPFSSDNGFSTTGNITAGYLVGNGVSITGITATANIGDITFVNTTISAPTNDAIIIQAVDNDDVVNSSLELDPDNTLTRLEQWSSQNSESFNTSDWSTGVYTNQGSLGAVQFTGAANMVDFVNSVFGATGHIFISVNGGPLLLLDGTGGGATDITFYTPTLPAVNPTVVTSFEYFYSYKSGFEIDYDSNEVNIYANDADITLLTTSQRDISLDSSGDVILTSNANGNTSNWTFGADGSLTFPIGISIDNSVDPVYPKIMADSGKLFSIQGQGANGSAAMAWSLNPNTDTQYAAVGVNQGGGDNLAKVVLTAGNTTPELKVWKFDQTGNITLPQGGIVYETTIPGGALTGNTIALKPQGGTNPDQQLLVYPTALGADANHLHLTTGNLYNTELFLGNDDLYVKLANTGDIVINSNDGVGNSAQWTFSPDSNLTLPGGSQIVDTPTGVLISGAGQTAVNRFYTKISNTLYQTVDVGITYNIIDQAGIWSLDVVGEDNPRYTSVDLITWADAGGGLPAPTGTIINGLANITVNGNTWTFGANGNLTLPANGYLRVTSGIVATNASPAPSLSGFSSVSAINLSASGNITGGNILTAGQVSANGNITTANSFVGNLIGTTVSITGNVTASNVNVTTGLTLNGTPIVANNAANLNSINTMTTTGNVGIGGNLSVTGNITGNGAGLTGVAKQTTGSWTVTPGTATYSFTVPAGTYAMWVSGNIPNGIIVWNATATITNTNVPVVGQQFAWVYDGGGTPLDFVSIPNQFVGTGNAIVRSNTAPSSTTNRFDFSINNTSGGNANVSYGYTAL